METPDDSYDASIFVDHYVILAFLFSAIEGMHLTINRRGDK